MQITLGFFVLFFIVILPGLIFRRLYYYGEFSKQFNFNHNIASLLAISSIPGLVILLLNFFVYNYLVSYIDIGVVVDMFKDLNNPNYRYNENDMNFAFRESVFNKFFPFLGFIYLFSFITGILSGRIVRITKLDAKFKLLRFKNYWFYLFNGQNIDFKKMKFLRKNDKKHIFTYADILIDTESQTYLYSGIVVDYELDHENYNILSKIIIREAKRYGLEENHKKPISIPGDLFILDCLSLKNINLTYVYEDSKSSLDSKWPKLVQNFIGILFFVLLPIFLFNFQSINWDTYTAYFSLNWPSRILIYISFFSLINLFNPFVKKGDVYKMVGLKEIMSKIGLIILVIIILLLINSVG